MCRVQSFLVESGEGLTRPKRWAGLHSITTSDEALPTGENIRRGLESQDKAESDTHID